MSYFNFLDKNIYYEISGEGEILVLLNGIMMSTKSWEPFINDINKHFKVIRVDFFDQGQSESYDTEYSLDIQVELVKNLLEFLKIPKVNLVGSSYGGEVSIIFAAKYPQMVNRVILYNTVGRTSKELFETFESWNKYAKMRDAQKYYDVTIPVIYSKKFMKENEEWMENRKKLLINGPFSNEEFLERMIRLTISASKHNQINNLEKITADVMIISSQEDLIMPPEEQMFLKEKIKNSSIIYLPDVGHASFYEVPSIFMTILIGFLKADLNIKI